jgi:hypothetical protein
MRSAGSAADNTGDKLDGVGNKSKTTAKNVAPLRDRLQDLGTMFRDSGDAGGRFGDILDMVSVATTPTGLGIVALVGTFASAKIAVDAVTASLSLYIETNDEAAAAASRLKESTATLNESVIDLATGEGGLAAMLEASVILSDKAASATDRLAKSTKESTAAFGENSLAAAALHTPLSLAAEMSRRAVIANEQLTQSNIGLASSFGGVVSAASSAASAIASAASSAASSFAVILGLQESAASATIRQGISALAQSPLGKTLGEAGVLTFPGQAPKFRGGGGGGKKGKSRAELLQEESGALVDEMMGDLLQDPAFLATLVPEAVVSPMLTAGLGAMDEAELQTKLTRKA